MEHSPRIDEILDCKTNFIKFKRIVIRQNMFSDYSEIKLESIIKGNLQYVEIKQWVKEKMKMIKYFSLMKIKMR